MAIFRGVGGSGSSSDNSFLQEVTAQATTATNKANEASASAASAEASATSAANSLATIQNTEVTSASFNTGDGVLTLTKLGGATVTADLDGRFLTSYTETNDLASAVTWVNVPNAYITEGSVTQHQAALTITESQISDLQSYLTSYTETNNLTTAVTWANVPDANITESSVTQHLTAANVTSPLTGGTGISIASNGTITNDSPDQTVALTGTGATTVTGTYPNFTIDSTNTTYTIGDGGLTTNDFTDADHTKLNGIEANATADQTGAEIKSAYEAVADTNAFTDAEKSKLSGIEASADVTDTANVTSAGAAMLASSPTFTGTITAPNVDINTTGSVTTNIATGDNNDNNTDVKVVNIGTGYGSGFYSGLSTTINMGSQSSSTKNIFNLGSGVSVSGREDTINLKGNVTVDGTVDGRDVATDGTKLDTIPYHRVRYEKLRYNNASVTLTTSYQNISQAPEIYSPTTSVKCSRYIDFQTEIEWKYISTTNNDLKFKLEVTVPTSNATVTTLGTATAGTFSGYSTSGFEGWFYVSGDFTHHLTAFGRMNKTGVSGATEVPARAWQYDAVNNRTYILTDSNPVYYVSTGDTIYWHPYAWESAGTTLFVEDTLSERYVGTGSRQNITLRFKTAYDNNQLKYKAYLKELTTSDSGTVRGGEATLTEVGEV